MEINTSTKEGCVTNMSYWAIKRLTDPKLYNEMLAKKRASTAKHNMKEKEKLNAMGPDEKKAHYAKKAARKRQLRAAKKEKEDAGKLMQKVQPPSDSVAPSQTGKINVPLEEDTLPLPDNLLYDKMKVFMPPAKTDNVVALVIIENLNKIFLMEKKPICTCLTALANQDFNGDNFGVRRINGNRFELFVEAQGKGTAAFDWIINNYMKDVMLSPDDMDDSFSYSASIRSKLVEFANERARKDERIGVGYEFHNHALILSYGNVSEQDIHIDLHDKDHYQFGLICCNDVPGTCEYRPVNPVLVKGDSLKKIWNDMPDGLANKINSDFQSKELLNGYGCLLSDCPKINTTTGSNKFPIGTLLSLPGGVPHAGPASNGFRSVLFFTGTQPDECPYNPDVQHCKTTLVSELLRNTWTGLNQEEREYLLNKWNVEGIQKDKTGLHSVNHKHLRAMGEAIKKKRKNAQSSFIASLSKEKCWNDNPELWDDIEFNYKIK